MVKVIATVTTGGLNNIIEQAKEYVDRSKSANTLRAYQSDWRDFETWCNGRGTQALPATPQIVALYLTFLAGQGIKSSTIQRRVTAISQAHQAAGEENPTRHLLVRAVTCGIRRVHGTRQEGKAPALTEDIRVMVDSRPDNLLGLRDRALLLVGFAGAFRRSEIVGLDVENVEQTKQGLVITLGRSKTDQERAGRKVGLPYGSKPATCPVRAVQGWLEATGLSAGPLFRSVNRHGQLQDGRLSDKAVALVVKRAAEAAGLDSSRYAGHSLRAGLATSAAAAGVSERSIMAQTGHRSVTMVRRYIREGSLFRDNAAAGLGL